MIWGCLLQKRPFLPQNMLALLVGGCGSWAVSRKTPIYFILYSNKFHQNFLFVIKKTWHTYKKTWNAYKKREMHTKQYHTYIYIYVCMYVCMYRYVCIDLSIDLWDLIRQLRFCLRLPGVHSLGGPISLLLLPFWLLNVPVLFKAGASSSVLVVEDVLQILLHLW